MNNMKMRLVILLASLQIAGAETREGEGTILGFSVDCPVSMNDGTVAYIDANHFVTLSDFGTNRHRKLYRATSSKLINYEGQLLIVMGSRVMKWSPQGGLSTFINTAPEQVIDMEQGTDGMLVVLTEERIYVKERMKELIRGEQYPQPRATCGRIGINFNLGCVVCSVFGKTHCYTMDGVLKWTNDGPFVDIAPPLISETGEVVVAARRGGPVYCYSLSGAKKWEMKHLDVGYFDGCITGRFYVTGGMNCTMVYNLEDGKFVGRHNTQTPDTLTYTPDGVLIVCSTAAYLLPSGGVAKQILDLPRGWSGKPFLLSAGLYGIIKGGPLIDGTSRMITFQTTTPSYRKE